MKLNKRAMIFLCSMLSIQLSYTATAAPTCLATLPEATPTTRFILDDSNGTALDTQTQLMWSRCLYGQVWSQASNSCTGLEVGYNWKDALDVANSVTFAGHSDWRLPNTKELFSIAETRCYHPALNIDVFKNAGSNLLWTSSPYLTNAPSKGQNAVTVNFYYGSTSNRPKRDLRNVRLVRSN